MVSFREKSMARINWALGEIVEEFAEEPGGAIYGFIESFMVTWLNLCEINGVARRIDLRTDFQMGGEIVLLRPAPLPTYFVDIDVCGQLDPEKVAYELFVI